MNAVINMIHFFTIVYDKHYEKVIDYFKSIQVFMVNALQRVVTIVYQNNQSVMMWYCDDSTCSNDEERTYASILSRFYQYLSLMSYEYGFVFTI